MTLTSRFWFTLLATLSLILGLVTTSGFAWFSVRTAERAPLTLRTSDKQLTVDQPFTVTLDPQESTGDTFMLQLPHSLNIDETATKSQNKSIKTLEMTALRELRVTVATTAQPQPINLVLTAQKAQTITLQAKTTIQALTPTDDATETADNQTIELASNVLELTIRAQPTPEPAIPVVPKLSQPTEKAGSSLTSSQDAVTESSATEKSETDQDQATTTSTKQAATTSEKAPTATPKAAAEVTPLTTSVITSYAALKTAYADNSVTTIELGANITQSGTAATDLGTRTSNLTIDGKGYALDIGVTNFRLGSTTTAQTFTLKNFSTIRSAATSGTGTAGSLAIVQSGSDGGTTEGGAKWTINLADLTTDSSVLRLVNSPGNLVNISGTVNSTTVWESMVTGGVAVAADAHFTARKKFTNGENRSFFWFSATSTAGTGTRQFTIGTNAVVDTVGAPSDTSYPVIYNQYDSVTVGTGATLIAKMYGNAYRAERANTFTANTGSKVTLENLSTSGANNAVNYGGLLGSSTFTVNSGAELYITNNAPVPVFGGNLLNVSILLDSLKAYDIKNTSTGLTAATGSIVNVTIQSFEIRNTNLSMWSVTLPISVSAKATFKNVEWIKQTLLVVTSSDLLLVSLFSFSLARRINNTLAIPTAKFSSPYTASLGQELVTDADKQVRVRVIVSYSESGGTQTPVYATSGQASVLLTDDLAAQQTATTDANGYATFTLNHYPLAGKSLSAQVTTTIQSDPVSITVQDKTPPAPVTVTNGKIVADQTSLTGTGAEPGSVLRYTVNSQSAVNASGTPLTTTASSTGSWTLATPTPKLKANDVIQLFAKDAAGNENPMTATTYHDNTFAAATSYTVAPANGPTKPTIPDAPGTGDATDVENPGTGNTGELRLDYAPSRFNFGTVKTSMQRQTYTASRVNNVAKQWLQVSDNRLNATGWQVTVAQPTAFTSSTGKTLTGAELKLPVGHTYNEHTTTGLTSYGLTVNNAAQPIFRASSGNGRDLSTNVWAPEDVSLTLPGQTAVRGETYTTTINWTLTASVS